MKKLIYLFILLFFAQTICAQSISNSLFLVVDKQTDSIKVSSKDSINFKYYHFNKKKNWLINLSHIYVPGADQNNYKYLLPKEMISELGRKGNLEDIQAFMAKLNHFNYKELAQFFIKHYSYYYEYLQKSRKKTYKRYNIFIIFKSDLDKTFVPCYEMTLLKSRITEI
ncbi:MAG: hypothetical protein ACTH5N_03480 [Psychroflexus halocasei]|uniref:hypothetical protein n=1 Tax=Psychroflexus sp. S27 TaxID=1982757 RepID=UPI000C2A5F10|nr:hypothetical protein [Psychroflexus sp. S27]PJX21539.1 hypothetical protein CAP47_07795 [Psychroflexus sp. S27]